MKKTLYILTFLIILTTSYSQKEYYNWYFGNGAGITFNTPDEEPIFLEGNLSSTLENTAIISNSNGELLFYSANNCLYDKDKDILCDVDTVAGHRSLAQGSVIVPIDSNTFIRIGNSYLSNYDSAPLTYLIFNNENNSFQIENHDTILKNYISENVLVIKDFNSKSFYLVVNDRYQSFYKLFKYEINSKSFRMIQSLPSKFIVDNNTGIQPGGYLKSTISGKYIASFHVSFGVELLEFDNLEEKLSFKSIIARNPNLNNRYIYYSGEFSPNEEYLYFVTPSINSNYLSRVKTSDDNLSPEVENLFNVNKNVIGPFLLGPNSKIYFPSETSNYLSSIEKPNNATNVEYIAKSVNLKTTGTRYSLPNIPTTYYNPYYIYLLDSIQVCMGKQIQFKIELYLPFKVTNYVWSGPNGFISDLPNPIIENANLDDSGTYTVTVYNSDSTIRYTREIVVNVLEFEDPEIIVVPDSIVCNTDEVKIVVVNTYENFEWSTGETTREIKVTESGKYSIEYTNDNGCVGYTEVNISFGEDITMDILGPTEICEGSVGIYSADRDYETYLWSNSDTTKTAEISEAGKYWLEVTTAEGCTISDTIDITYHPSVIAELKPAPTTICEGDSVLLESVNDFPYYSYEWNTGATTRGIYVKSSATYKLTITDTRTGCVDSTEIAISVEENLQPTIDGMNICDGNPATLEALPNDSSYSYEWSNGKTTPTIVVSQPATYTVTVSKDGCTGTADFTVNENPNPEFEILGEDIVCGSIATLSSDKDFAEYLWSTDEVTKEIEVTEAGTYSLTVTDEKGCSATEEFTVNEQSLSFDISKDRIDFGKVYISENASDSATIINTSGFQITITDGTQDYIIPDGFPVKYKKDLDPTELGPYTDSFEYRVISPCDTVITIPVTAEVYARVTISSDNIETEIGKEETISVYLKAIADLGEQTYTITTNVDQSVLYTQDEFVINQTAEINEAKTKIQEINGMIMLANELEYDITFPSYDFNNPYIEVSTEQGSITIDSVCAFPLRAVTFIEATEMRVSPNPAKDKLVVDVHSEENTIMTLELISSEGRVAYTENWTQTASEKQLNINTDKIPSGLYQVRLQTPSGVLTENVIVVR